MEPGVPLLLAPGSAPGLLPGYFTREAPAFSGPVLPPHFVCPNNGASLFAPAPRLSAFRSAGLCHLGSSAGHPSTLPVHLPQVWNMLTSISIATNWSTA